MSKFYTKNDNGEFIEADREVDEEYRRRSADIVSERIAKTRESDAKQIRKELEVQLRKELTDLIKQETKAELESHYQAKVEEAESRSRKLDLELRRKTIAAEYGFKPEVESFLGDGDEESMRQKADTLKSNFGQQSQIPAPAKETSGENVGNSFVKLQEN